jgi:hypothetical protein
MDFGPPLASVLTGALEVAGVWLASMGIFSGAGAAHALFTGESGDEIGRQASYGFAAGFIVGIPLTIAAGLLLVLT